MDKLALNIFNKIQEFYKSISTDNSLSTIIGDLLSIFDVIPNIKYVSLFRLNKDNFEFYHSRTKPSEFENEVIQNYDYLVEKGLIGKALSTLEPSNNFYDEDKEKYLIIPLIDTSGICGLIIIKAMQKFINDDDCNFFILFGHNIGYIIENIELNQKFKKNQELLDQQVAYRTMKLVESQKEMADKFESLRSNLSMSIPHEVRTPINQILGFSDFLLKYYETTEIEDAHEMLRDINSSAKRLKELFENYLYYANLSIISTNVYEIMNLQQKVTPSIQTIIFDILSYKAELYNRVDDFKVEEVDDMAVAISEEFIKKAFSELIDNALKYSEPKTEIQISCKKVKDENISSDGVCEIKITDHGRGMTKEQIENIDAYMQFDRKVYEQQGSGLGLSIVQRIIDLHNGYFKIDSEPGKYTTVSIKIPISKKMEAI